MLRENAIEELGFGIAVVVEEVYILRLFDGDMANQRRSGFGA